MNIPAVKHIFLSFLIEHVTKLQSPQSLCCRDFNSKVDKSLGGNDDELTIGGLM